MENFLNEMYSSYQAGDIDRCCLEGSVYTYLMKNQGKTTLCYWKNHDYEDFISWFYPRLRKSIDSCAETGMSFETILNRYLLLSSKEYQLRTTKNAVTEVSAWNAMIPEMYAYEETPVYTYKNYEHVLTEMIYDRKGKVCTKRILALILKCYYYISEDFAEKIAKVIGIEKIEIKAMLEKVKKIRQKRDDEIYLLKERIYCQFYRCIVYEKRLSYLNENKLAGDKVKRQLEKARKRLENMRQRITSTRTGATNSQIADIIGTRKSIVDSSLHQLKIKWKNLAKNAPLN
ncbi:MAG: hypothetical protein FWD28_09885 [Treponema sp.]|nr:hypothetical protein [Treponema sp.]